MLVEVCDNGRSLMSSAVIARRKQALHENITRGRSLGRPDLVW